MKFLARLPSRVQESKAWPGFWLAVRLLVSAGLVAWLVLEFDWRETWQAMTRISFWGLGALILGLLLNRLFAFYRFWVLLQSEQVEIDLGTVMRVSFLSVFAGNFLPTTVGGDLAKIGWLATLSGNKPGSERVSGRSSLLRMAFWTLFDRLSNMLAVGLLAPFCLLLPFLQVTIARWLHGWTPDFAFSFMAFALLNLVAGIALSLGKPGSGKPGLKPTEETQPVEFQGSGLFQKALWSWKKLLARRRIFGLLVLISFLSIAPNLLATWLAARDLGINVELWGVTAVYVILYFVTLLPVSINGLGLQEVSTITLYESLGASAPQAVALAILLRFAIWITTLPGVFWLSRGVARKSISSPGPEPEQNSDKVPEGP